MIFSSFRVGNTKFHYYCLLEQTNPMQTDNDQPGERDLLETLCSRVIFICLLFLRTIVDCVSDAAARDTISQRPL